jgi:glycerol-3-phosphate acyltransferase PlsY
MSLYVATAAIAYLLGSVPFGYILVRAFHGGDVRESGSGNIGATNVARSSLALGILTLLLDAAKGFSAVLAGLLLGEIYIRGGLMGFPSTAFIRHQFLAIAAVFAVLGHMLPVWLKFRGGKGVATSVGVFLALAPKTLLLAVALFIALVAAFRYVSLGSIIAAIAFPFIAYGLHDYHSSPEIMAAISLISALVILKHHENIRRLLAGKENRFALKRTRP